MKDFFSTEGSYYRMASVLGDIAILGILWLIFSLPIITMGASTTGLYYVCTKKKSGRDEYIFRGFIKSFKENFGRSTAVTAILILIFYVVWINFSILPTVDFGGFSVIIYMALYFVLIQTIFVTLYVFPLISRFEVSVVGSLKSAFIMANKYLFTTLTNLVLFSTIIVISIIFPLLIIFIMGFYIYFSSFLFVKIFRKHYPNFDEPQMND